MKQPTVESVKDGLAKTIREIRILQGEVRKLNESIGHFASQTPYEHLYITPEMGGGSAAKPQTSDPQSEIAAAIYQYRGMDNLEAPTKTLFAMAKELDNALRDVRAMRANLEAIKNDADVRADFQAWVSRNQG